MTLEYLDFQVIKEAWNRYELSDGSILITKGVVFAFIKREDGQVGINSSPPLVGLSYVPRELLGEPAPAGKVYRTEEVLANIVEDDMRFKVNEEGWNEYKLKEGTFGLKLALAKVSKSSLRNLNGEPVYNVQTSPVQKFTPAKK